MKEVLTKGLDKDAAEEMELAFRSASLLRKRLAQLLEDKQRRKVNASLNDKVYDSPNWAYKQADRQGYATAIKEILTLLE